MKSKLRNAGQWAKLSLLLMAPALVATLVYLCTSQSGIAAVGGANTTTLAEDLKEFYLPGYNNELNNSTYLFDRIKSGGSEIVGGAHVNMFAVNKRHSGGARAELQPLPTAGSTGGFNPQSTTSKIFMPLMWSGDLLDKAKNDRDAYIKALDLEMETAQDDGRVLLHQYLWLAKNAFRARVSSSTTTGGVISVDNDGLPNSVPGARLNYILPGYYLDSVNSSGVVSQSGLLVVSTSPSANTITVTLNGAASAGAVTDNDYLVLGDRAGGANDYNQGVSGIPAAIPTSNNTYWNIDRSLAANAVWRPQVVDGTGFDFSDPNVWRRPMSMAEKYGANPEGKMVEGQLEEMAILTSIEGRDKFGGSLTVNQRYVNTTELKGGWTALEAHGRPMVADKDCPLGYYYYLHWKDFQLYSELGSIGMSLEDRDGLTVRWLQGYDCWISILRARMELGCKKPNRQAVMSNVPMNAY